jgi:hypothetical protein
MLIYTLKSRRKFAPPNRLTSLSAVNIQITEVVVAQVV